MTSDLQKSKEKMFASQLALALGLVWDIELPLNEEEWPDLIIHEGSRKFGLEIREITKDKETKKGSVLKANEHRNSKFIKYLADCYYHKSNIPIKVEISGELENKTEILKSLLKISSESEVSSKQRLELNENLTIHVTHLPSETYKYNWNFIGDKVGWAKKIDSQFIYPFVVEKETKLVKYRTHLNDIRLLLVADRTYSSGMISPIEPTINIKTDFNEIYLFLYPENVYQIKS